MTNSPNPPPARVVLYTRTGCQLCVPARGLVARLAEGAGLAWAETVIDTDPELRAEYGDRVPVIEFDGDVIAELVVDEAGVAAALRAG